MTRAEFIDRSTTSLSSTVRVDGHLLAPALLVDVSLGDWTAAAALAKELKGRFSAFWIDFADEKFLVYCLVEIATELLLLRTGCESDEKLQSIAHIYPSADRPERHARDLYGICLVNAPDARRWIRHQAWGEHEFPLRGDGIAMPAQTTIADDRYPFVSAQGSGIVEIPVGPVHAGIIEPGHFRFQAVGETVLNLEQHLGYTHKGIERIATGRAPDGLARLAGRVSGDSTVAHTWAACQALERAGKIEVPARALWLRALMTERERVANHMGDIGAICNDVGFIFAQSQLTRLKELWLRENHRIFGHRLMMDRIVPGGVSVDIANESLAEMLSDANRLAVEFQGLIDCFENSESLEDRLMTTGALSLEQANMLGATGYVGKASGQDYDARRDTPCAPYNRLDVEVPVYHAGDVAARAKVRADEVIISLRMIGQIIESLPEGPIRSDAEFSADPSVGLGIIEGWRGEIVSFVRLDANSRVARFYPRDPSWLIWPALELLLQGNIVPDFPVCNKSVNGSYSGQDL